MSHAAKHRISFAAAAAILLSLYSWGCSADNARENRHLDQDSHEGLR